MGKLGLVGVVVVVGGRGEISGWLEGTMCLIVARQRMGRQRSYAETVGREVLRCCDKNQFNLGWDGNEPPPPVVLMPLPLPPTDAMPERTL